MGIRIKTGNQIRKNLEDRQFEYIGTCSFEGDGIEQPQILDAIKEMLATLESPPGGGRLDHLWIYLDSPNQGT